MSIYPIGVQLTPTKDGGWNLAVDDEDPNRMHFMVVAEEVIATSPELREAMKSLGDLLYGGFGTIEELNKRQVKVRELALAAMRKFKETGGNRPGAS